MSFRYRAVDDKIGDGRGRLRRPTQRAAEHATGKIEQVHEVFSSPTVSFRLYILTPGWNRVETLEEHRSEVQVACDIEPLGARESD